MKVVCDRCGKEFPIDPVGIQTIRLELDIETLHSEILRHGDSKIIITCPYCGAWEEVIIE